MLTFGDPTAFPVGSPSRVKPFVSLYDNTILPYVSINSKAQNKKITECLDQKQLLWAFFVVRSVAARSELKVG
jgi:hypothetical protein